MMRDAQRILREMRKTKAENTDEMWLQSTDENIRHWKCVLKGPNDTPYANYYFEIDIHIPEGYPIEPPTARCVTPIFHPNIRFKTGEVCLDILKSEWTPAWGLQSLCQAIRVLLDQPAPDSPLNTLAGNLLRCGDFVGYNCMASLYARRFALKSNFLRERAEKTQN